MLDLHRMTASLYVPAVHPKLECALRGLAYPAARSWIACTEDAIADAQLDQALAQLGAALPALPARNQGPLRFVRPRNAEVLAQILAMPDIDRIHGFVIPKADHQSLPAYLKLLETDGRAFAFMPTLETIATFDAGALLALRTLLLNSALKSRCVALRIGANDLLALLGMRRPRGVSIYQTPLGVLIGQLVLCFKPHGFQLTGAVFDYLDQPELLRAEAQQDRHMGLIGKTAIHPDQVSSIEAAFLPDAREVAAARTLTQAHAPAVMSFDGAMLEHAVHGAWARQLLQDLPPDTNNATRLRNDVDCAPRELERSNT
jgi:citrate lyase beta subunit